MADFLSKLASGIGRGVEMLGTLGTADLYRNRAEEQNRQLGQILSGQSMPAFARPGGAEPYSPEVYKQTQLAQLAQLGTPQALAVLGKLSPLAQGSQDTSAPSAVREYQFVQKLTPEERTDYLNIKRADPFRAKGLIERDGVVTPISGYGEALGGIGGQESYGTKLGELTARMEKEPDITAANVSATKRAEREVKNAETEKVRAKVTNRLTEMASLYKGLDEMNALVDPKKTGIENIVSRVGASDIGQLLGGATGSKEQELRQQIEQMRPTLMSDIRQATEMGAKGLDSEKELEFYLQAVSDPRRTLKANMAALKVLDSAYGLGASDLGANAEEVKRLRSEFAQVTDDSAVGTAPQGVNPQDWEYLTPKERALWQQ